MNNITLNEHINLFRKNKAKETLGMRSHDAFVCRHDLARACRVLEIMKYKFFALKTKVWDESHIVQESFQTLIFTI